MSLPSRQKAIEGELLAAGDDLPCPPELVPAPCQCGNSDPKQFGIPAVGGGTIDFVSGSVDVSCKIRLLCLKCDRKGPVVEASFLPHIGPSMAERRAAVVAWNEQVKLLEGPRRINGDSGDTVTATASLLEGCHGQDSC